MPETEASPCIDEEQAFLDAVSEWESAREDCINAAEDVLLAVAAVGIACTSLNPACALAIAVMLEMNDRLEDKVDDLHEARTTMDEAMQEFLDCADNHKEYYDANYGHVEID